MTKRNDPEPKNLGNFQASEDYEVEEVLNERFDTNGEVSLSIHIIMIAHDLIVFNISTYVSFLLVGIFGKMARLRLR